MTFRVVKTLIVLLLLLLDASFAFSGGSDAPKPVTMKIVVNGRTLNGPGSSAIVSGGRAMVPAAVVARALGATVTVDPSRGVVGMRRSNGTQSSVDRDGKVIVNGTIQIAAADRSLIVIDANVENVMLPGDVIAAMLDVSVQIDGDAVIVSTNLAPSSSSSHGASLVDIYRIDAEYNFTRYATGGSADSLLTSVGRFGDSRYFVRLNSSGPALRPRFVNGLAEFVRPNEQRFAVGDVNLIGRLSFLTTQFRGASAAVPVGGVSVTAFGGRMMTRRGDGSRDVRTTIVGAMVTSERQGRRDPLVWSAGVVKFGGDTLATASVNYDSTRIRFSADSAVGKFAGGTASAVDVAATYQVFDSLVLQARYSRAGKNFFMPRNGAYEAPNVTAAGLSWSPRRSITASLSGSTATSRDGKRSSFLTATTGFTRGDGRTRMFISHTENRLGSGERGQFTLVNAATARGRTNFFANATRIKTMGLASASLQLGALFHISDRQQIEASQTVGSRGMMNGQLDWRSSMPRMSGLRFSAGLGYSRSGSTQLRVDPRFTATMRLPRESSLDVNYLHTATGSALVVRLKATIFRKREASSYVGASIIEAAKLGGVSGRVYQDVNGNGTYDPGTDKPQSGVTVRIDGSRYATTDQNGLYSMDAISAGEHRLGLDLTSVRADLTMIDAATRAVAIPAGRNANGDFILVRTGRIAGCVFIDANGNGRYDDRETTLGDVRVVLDNQRDTLTDADGRFSIADLAPGDHSVTVDGATLPEKLVVAREAATVKVFEAKETGGVWIAIIPTRAEVKRFGRPAN